MKKQVTPQQQLALDYEKNISLVANAGSGKTFVLSKRFVEIYVNEEVDLNSIVAITFTDKAAGELNNKIAEEIEERLADEKNERKKRRLEKLSRELVFSNISTIHSFCINILKEFAPEAGIDASFSPIDKETSEDILDQAIEETFQNLIKDVSYSEELKYLIRIFGSRTAFKSVLENSIQQRRKINLINNRIYCQTDDQIIAYLNNEFDKKFRLIFSDRIKTLIESISVINRFVLSQSSSNIIAVAIVQLLSEYNPELSILKQISFLSSLKKEITTSTEGTVKNRGYLSKEREKFSNEIELTEKIFHELKIFFECDLTGKSNIELVRLSKSFIHVFSYMSNLYFSKKKHHSFLDFEDILLFTKEIIAMEAVQKYLREKYKFIMVDEYQDTNELQYEIIMPILDNLRNGNLFVVGDEKQSIYMFREADLELFNRTKNEIENAGARGLLLSLPHSFRMFPQLVLFTNKLFTNLFADPDEEFNEVAHSNLVCTKDKSDIGEVGVLLADSNSEIRESELVAAKINELVAKDNNLPLGEIAILCRKRDSFAELEKTFVSKNIPFTIVGGKGFYQRQTIYDIHNYLSFLLNPKDDAALIGILRSPFFNYSDSKLFLISQQKGRTFYEKLNKYLHGEDEASNIINKLDNYRMLVHSIEPYKLIRRILLECGYWALLSSKQNHSQELANIEKLLSLARDYSKKGFKNLYDFVSVLKKSIEGMEDEGQAQVSKNDKAVQLMTIHQSKGLEFKAVFIYEANTKGQEDGIRARSIALDKNYGLLAKVPTEDQYFNKYSTPPVAALYNYSAKRKNRGELKRLFYVAVTRAVKYLFISASHKEMKANEGSFFQLLLEGLHNNLTGEKLYLADNVDFMRMKENQFQFEKELVELDVTIESKENPTEQSEPPEDPEGIVKKIINRKIYDYPKNEIISATKISMFAQCPVKYELTYDLGYRPILNLIKSQNNEFDFHPNEDDEAKQFAQLRGKVIHKLLSEDLTNNDLNALIRSEIEREESISGGEELISSIKDDLNTFMASQTYQEIISFSKFEKEFEVYCKDDDNNLFGIIDRLIFLKGKLLVIDYKTDNIKIEQIKNRAESYFPQLKFYAYILSRLYPETESFELRLVFLKHPEENISTLVDRKELAAFGKIIADSVQNIYKQNFVPNYSHCAQCFFALEGNKCVKQ